MTSIRKIFLSALASVIGFVSCQKDDTLYYSNLTMGNVVDGVFISDQGNRFDIREQTCEGRLDTMKRAIITCDVLAKTAESTYDIRLTELAGVFTKAPVDSSAVTDQEVFVEDPLMVYEMWYAGGYINMYVLIPFKIGSSQVHLINLVRNDKDAAPGTYEFTLKHNAFGEVASSGEGQYTLGGTYMSFPVVGLFEGDEADIIIHWNSGEDAGDDADAEGKRNSLVYKWKSGGFEQDMNP